MDSGQLTVPMRRDILRSKTAGHWFIIQLLLIVVLSATWVCGEIITIEGQKHLRIGRGTLDLTLPLSPEGTLSESQVSSLRGFLVGLRRIEQEGVSRTLFHDLDIVYQGPLAPLLYEELTKNAYNVFFRQLSTSTDLQMHQPHPRFPLISRDGRSLVRFNPLQDSQIAFSPVPLGNFDHEARSAWSHLGELYQLMQVKLAAHPPAATAGLERLWAEFPGLVAQALADQPAWPAENRRIYFQALLDGTAPHLRDPSAQEMLRQFARDQSLRVTFAAPRRGPLFE